MVIVPGTNATVSVAYRLTTSRDIGVQLVRGDSVIAQVRVPADGPGRASTDIAVPIPASAAKADDFRWLVGVLPRNAEWNAATSHKEVKGVFLDETVTGGDTVAADDPNLTYEGRWDLSNPKSPAAFWQGSAVCLRFSGTSAQMHLCFTSWDASHQLALLVSVDGGEPKTITLKQNPDQMADLVTGLPDGSHTLQVLKDGPEDTSTYRVLGFKFDSGHGLLRNAPFMPGRAIEAYGDSTVSGGMGGMYVNYTTTTARDLGASLACISKGGTGVGGAFVFNNDALYYWDRLTYNYFVDERSDTNKDGKIDEGDQFARNPYQPGDLPVKNPTEAGPSWGLDHWKDYGDPNSIVAPEQTGAFARNQKDVIIVGYGQNDQFVDQGSWPACYKQLVTLIRKVYPHAQIILTQTCMTGNPGFLKAAMDPIVADTAPGGLNADGHVHEVLLYPSGNPEEGHPSARQHKWMAEGNDQWPGLVETVSDIMDW